MGDGQAGIAFDAKGLDAEFALDGASELGEGGGGDGDEVLAEGAGGVWVARPAERLVETAEDVVVVRVGVDGVVQAIDDEVMLLDEGALGKVDGIAAEVSDVVAVVIEGWLVADDEVIAAANGFAQHVEGVEEGGGDAGDGRCGVAGLEGVNRIRGRGGGVVGVDARPGLGGGERRLRVRAKRCNREE